MTTSSNSKSFGLTIGRALGYTGAAIAHGAITTAKATGRFGEDVLVGTTTGYTEHSARLAGLRLAAANARPASIAISSKSPARRTAKA